MTCYLLSEVQILKEGCRLSISVPKTAIVHPPASKAPACGDRRVLSGVPKTSNDVAEELEFTIPIS